MEAVAKQSWEPYQVFINHRGEDTKKNIASLIYHALEPYGLPVFLDQYVLSPGDNIETEIRRAISSSSVHIAIFSKNYAESRWCLNELLWMLKSSHGPKFIPIFCDVEPVELRFIKKGCYAKAFQKHLARESKKLVDEWAKILREAADISGKVFKGKKALGEAAGTSDRVFNWKESDYGKLVRNIENIVIEHVKRDPLELPPRPVGLDQAWKDLDDQIKKQSSKRVVVIAGLGGIGKSTLARYIFNELSRSEFRRASYLSKVRETDHRDLQRQLCRDLLGKNMSDSWREGKTMLRKGLKGLKVLIVFDDVDDREKINDEDDREKIRSVVDLDAVEPGSLILITSRYKDIVGGSSASTFLYDLKPLKRNHARELFCHHAFHQLNPPEKYGDLVEDFLKICGGLPLCLKVLGEQVSSNSDRAHWERQLKLYSQGASLPEANDVIKKLLKWSCKDMDREQQRMLLDVAYFLVGEDKELAVQVLEGLDYMKDVHYSLNRLCETYLISFKNDVDYDHDETKREELRQMHRRMQLLRRLDAWEPSKEEASVTITDSEHSMEEASVRIRDWRHSMEEALRSLSAAFTKGSSKLIMHNQVREMARYIVREDQSEPLRLSCAVDIEKQSGSLSRQVRGICIRRDQSPSQLPMGINITGVRLLLVEHSIQDLSKFLASISGDLVWLRWRVSSFISLPRTISVRNLRVLELRGPQDVHDLEDFFSSIDEIPLDLRVLHMDITGYASSSTSSSAQPVELQHSKKSFDESSLSRFLRSIGTFMQNLTQIGLNIISESLPFDFSELKRLRHLDLSGSFNLTELPNSFSQLLQLQHLALRDCINLSIREHILGEISTLEHIDFKGCVKLEHLPQGIASQRRLRYLNLLETSLQKLPLTLEPPYELEQLIIGSNRFRELACSVDFLGKLKELFLVGCFELEHISMPIEELTCLERLEIYGSKLRILPAGISLLKHLKVLTIISCPIENFSLDNNVMDALTDLTLTHTAISDLSIPAGACPMLEMVDLSHNCRLSQVELSQSRLVKLNLKGCQNLQDLNLPKLGRLKFLNIKECGYLAIQRVAECGSLEEITAEWYCFRIKEAWSQLRIYGSELRKIPAGISLLKHLKVLTILPAGIAMLKHLKVLTIDSCPIENFSLDNNVMDALTDLTLTHTDISDLSIPAGACPMLEIVDLSHNRRLREVEVSQSTLVKLNLEGCENLQHTNLPKLGRLKFLNIKRCGSVRIQNVAECGSLEEIMAEECRFTINAAWSQLERPAWSQLERPAWSQLERLNCFTFLQYCYSFFVRTRNEYLERPAWSQLQRLNFFTFSENSYKFFWRRWKHLRRYGSAEKYEQEFEKFLNSFHGVTLREVPSTATHESPVVLKKVHSHSAILMCFITYRGDFVVRFEACNGGDRTEEFQTSRDYHRNSAWVHVYMWTQRSTLFTDEDNFYDNVSIYKKGLLKEEGDDRGWILTLSSENHVLDVLNQIINPSAEVQYGLDSAEYGLDLLFGE